MIKEIDEKTFCELEQQKLYQNLEEQLMSESHKKVVEYAMREKKRADTNWDVNYELREKLRKLKEIFEKLFFEAKKLLEE